MNFIETDHFCYPNPVDKLLSVDIDGIYANEIFLMNVDGQLLIHKVLEEDGYYLELDLEHFASGYYYVICKGEGLSSHTRTIIKTEKAE